MSFSNDDCDGGKKRQELEEYGTTTRLSRMSKQTNLAEKEDGEVERRNKSAKKKKKKAD